jgi:hypothetical protein
MEITYEDQIACFAMNCIGRGKLIVFPQNGGRYPRTENYRKQSSRLVTHDMCDCDKFK